MITDHVEKKNQKNLERRAHQKNLEGEHMALLNLEGYLQNMLATFVETGNINIRDELRDLCQQPNF